MEKRLPQLYYIKMKKVLMIWVLLQSESPWQRNDAITFFIYLCVSLYQEFFEKLLKGVCTCHNFVNYGKVLTNSIRAFSKYFETKF